MENTECFIVLGKLALTLKDMHFNRRLIISCGRENLALLGRYCSIALYDLCIDAAHGFYAERQRCNVEQEKSLNVAA